MQPIRDDSCFQKVQVCFLLFLEKGVNRVQQVYKNHKNDLPVLKMLVVSRDAMEGFQVAQRALNSSNVQLNRAYQNRKTFQWYRESALQLLSRENVHPRCSTPINEIFGEGNLQTRICY